LLRNGQMEIWRTLIALLRTLYSRLWQSGTPIWNMVLRVIARGHHAPRDNTSAQT
jgi:hypothetical protein